MPYHDGMGIGYPTVQLLHALPDGSSHVDWMLATDPDGVTPLVTFRLDRPVTELGDGPGMAAERLLALQTQPSVRTRLPAIPGARMPALKGRNR